MVNGSEGDREGRRGKWRWEVNEEEKRNDVT